MGLVYSYLTPSKLPRYLHTHGSSWAFLTGSTSGLGLALASELCARGFNVILHGRDLEKLESVQSSLATRFPDRQLDCIVLDAARCFSPDRYQTSLERVLKITRGRDVSLFINNVGVGHGLKGDFRALTDQSYMGVDFDTRHQHSIHDTSHPNHASRA
jgi:short-subunit dehydrogenase